MKNTIFILLILLVSSCKKAFIDSLPDCESSKPVFIALPINEDMIANFIPLGNTNQPSHVFPSGHHYFDIKPSTHNIPVYSIMDGWIISVTSVKRVNDPTFQEYDFTIASCKDVQVTYGHVNYLTDEILAALPECTDPIEYTTGGITGARCKYKTEIAIHAGQKLGEVKASSGISGIDLGATDTRVDYPYVDPDRWNEKGVDETYIHSVNILDYYTPEIRNILHYFISDLNMTCIHRTIEPLGGEICYDIAGTVMGLWFKPGESCNPEDVHLSLIKENFNPAKQMISTGISVPGLNPGAYEFYPEKNGIVNRDFSQVTNDGKIYMFHNFVNVWDQPLLFDGVILIQLIDDQTLRIEKQNESDGPDWKFKNNYFEFKR